MPVTSAANNATQLVNTGLNSISMANTGSTPFMLFLFVGMVTIIMGLTLFFTSTWGVRFTKWLSGTGNDAVRGTITVACIGALVYVAHALNQFNNDTPTAKWYALGLIIGLPVAYFIIVGIGKVQRHCEEYIIARYNANKRKAGVRA